MKTPKILRKHLSNPNPPKKEALGDIPRKINIGCGWDKKEGYLNIDSESNCDPDLLVTDNTLPELPRRWFDEVYAKDVLEHIPHADMMNALVTWNWLLRKNGELYVETSDIFGIIDLMRENGTFEFQYSWRVCLFGNQALPSDFHLNGFTSTTLRVYLVAAGFAVDKFDWEAGWLISTTAKKDNDWLELLEIESERDFIRECYKVLLDRDHDGEGMAPDRVNFLRYLIGCPERLLKIGAELESQ